jgi:spore maturation protein SpmA/spore maturation protein SpmB
LSGIFFAIVLIAFLVAAYRQVTGETVIVDDGVQSPMEALSTAVIDAASGAVTLSLGLIGVMALFLGLMKVAEHGGLLVVIAKTVRPLMVRLFPEVPADHPAMGAMILNLSANVLGLGNAATPFGIRAMQELDKINPVKGTATNAMALFLAINTSSVTLLPTGVIAIRAAAGSQDPAGILPTTLFATICSTTVAIIAARLYCNFWPAPTGPAGAAAEAEAPAQDPEEGLERETAEGYPGWVSALVLAAILAIIPLTILYGSAIAPWIIPALVVGLLAYGVARRVPIYDAFVEGAKDGFQVALRIIPYLVAILVAVGMAITGHFGMPAEALPMALLRPLSGSGAYGIMASIIQDPAIGPDSYVGYLVSTLQGSTETTFYVLAVYFGAVQIRRIRHAMAAALTADLAGIVAAVVICTIVFG